MTQPDAPMSPYEIGVLLHYHYSVIDHPNMYEAVPVWRQTIDFFKSEELLEEQAQGNYSTALYRLTDKGRCYVVDGLCCVPLPVATWKIPGTPR